MKTSWKEGQNQANRFLLAWLLLTVIGFSLVSGKQAKYLVPFLPAFALLAGYALTKVPVAARWWEMLLPAAGFLVAPAFLAYVRTRPESMRLPEWTGEIPLWPLALLALLAPALLFCCRMPVATQLRALAFAMLAAFAVAGAGIIPAFVPYSDPGPAARHLAGLQEAKVPLAHLGKYHAQYNFVGRLRAPIRILGHDELAAWVRKSPQGQVLTVERTRAADGGPEVQWAYRGAWLQVWRGSSLLAARPDLR